MTALYVMSGVLGTLVLLWTHVAAYRSEVRRAATEVIRVQLRPLMLTHADAVMYRRAAGIMQHMTMGMLTDDAFDAGVRGLVAEWMNDYNELGKSA